MNKENENLPELHSLKKYHDWYVFGTLTSSKRISQKKLIQIFEEALDDITRLSGIWAETFVYFARCETVENGIPHLHFVLGATRIKDSKRKPLTALQTCAILKNAWKIGNAKIVPYSEAEGDCLGYVTKVKSESDRDDERVTSTGLLKFIKNLEVKRDPLGEELMAEMQAKGAPAYWGDVYPYWRARAS